MTALSPETEQLSETEQIARALRGFRPRQAVRMLRHGSEPAFLKTWALARLLGWAIFDQRPGKRLPKTQPGDGKHRPERRLRTTTAKRIGHLTLAYLLDRQLQKEDPKTNDETLQEMLTLFTTCGGFGVFVRDRGAKGLLSQAKRANRELGYVYRIVLFLCRYKRYIRDDARFDIDSAKRFVEMVAHEDRDTYGLSKISKIWEQYKQAAPYIFAFYRIFLVAAYQSKSPEPSSRFSR